MKKQIMYLAFSIFFFSTFAKAEIATADFDINKCTKCHDATGAGMGFPILAGQTVDYFKHSLQAYVQHKRHSGNAEQLMSKRIIKLNLDAATINDLANYFNQLPTAPGAGSDPALMAAGKQIYEGGIPQKGIFACAACHGSKGEGMGLNARLAGQFKTYLTTQMQNYRNGLIDEADFMKGVAQKMSDSEVEAVASYLQAL